MEYTTLRRFLALATAVGAMTSLVIVASAQAPPQPGFGGRQGGGGGRGRFPGGGRGMSAAMLPVTTIDAMVKLSADQKTKITQIQDNFRKSMGAMRPAQGQRPAPGQQPDPALMQKMQGLFTQTNQAVEAVLTPAQKTKLDAGMKELAVYRLTGIPTGLYGQIKLTAAQKAGLQQIQQGMAGGQVDRTARQAAREKAAALLTPAQKTQIEEYQKAHPNEGRGGRGGGRGPGGPGGPGGRGPGGPGQ